MVEKDILSFILIAYNKLSRSFGRSEIKLGANKWLINKLSGKDDGTLAKSECPEIDIILSPFDSFTKPLGSEIFAGEVIQNVLEIESQRELSNALFDKYGSSEIDDRSFGRVFDKIDEDVNGIYKDGVSTRYTVSIFGYKLNFV